MRREYLVRFGEDAIRLSIDQVEIGKAEPHVRVARRQLCCSQQVNGRLMNLAEVVVRQSDLSNAVTIVAVEAKRLKVFLYGSPVLLSSEQRIAGR